MELRNDPKSPAYGDVELVEDVEKGSLVQVASMWGHGVFRGKGRRFNHAQAPSLYSPHSLPSPCWLTSSWRTNARIGRIGLYDSVAAQCTFHLLFVS